MRTEGSTSELVERRAKAGNEEIAEPGTPIAARCDASGRGTAGGR
jgi:hypothetical protein